MARIRTIKPEFWTDGSIIECSTNARLLFVGTWNFADDFGNLDRSAKQIKAQVFPADSFDCEPLIQELIDRRLLVEYSANGKIYLHIQSFAKHQKVDRPGAPRCPAFDDSLIVQRTFADDSTNDRRALATEGKGREGKGKNKPSEAFDRFWKAWPKSTRKGGKADCVSRWAKDGLDLVADQIVAHVETMKLSLDWRKESGAYIPAPLVYLNGKRWDGAEVDESSAPGELRLAV